MNQFFASRNTDSTFKQIGFARLVKPIVVIALQAGSIWFACERVLAADGPAALDRRRTRQYAS
jgi:hypothetical protein